MTVRDPIEELRHEAKLRMLYGKGVAKHAYLARAREAQRQMKYWDSVLNRQPKGEPEEQSCLQA